MIVLMRERATGLFIPARKDSTPPEPPESPGNVESAREEGVADDADDPESLEMESQGSRDRSRTEGEIRLDGLNVELAEVQELLISNRKQKKTEPVVWEALNEKETKIQERRYRISTKTLTQTLMLTLTLQEKIQHVYEGVADERLQEVEAELSHSISPMFRLP